MFSPCLEVNYSCAYLSPWLSKSKFKQSMPVYTQNRQILPPPESPLLFGINLGILLL